MSWSPYTPEHEPRDIMTTVSVTRFCWRDRLRILRGHSVRITTRTETENLVGATRNLPTVTEVKAIPRPLRGGR